ncbi:omptin family outer membrane protease [Pelobacter propionicus]|uniref:Protochlamydia outer membrane protein domain-containing protein n=1 Tax=Pelobacter propionicus (strain DSM 2379 / NBRC 103807 / OttBd1) TaxID=338966 RepID=A1AQS3_PELPD|nr:omptin family outer membrane protease [Pelobacter propionicus]ABK99693.1 hypothetical protein Ppro_2085 [Pelobacter propionicus DSM 2379]
MIKTPDNDRLGISLAAPLLVHSLFLLAVLAASPLCAAESDGLTSLTPYLSLGAKTKRLFNSHTSYEFGNPLPPHQKPFSRLEFPLDSWWGGAELRANYRRLSIGVEALRNLNGDVDGMMKDSDWDDDLRPDVRTIYSESKCRMEPSYMVRGDMDLEVADRIGLPLWVSLRPLIGFRWQSFHLVTHDGVQYEEGGSIALPGDGISFWQTYWQYFIGLRSDIDLGRLLDVGGLNLLMQLDWAYVEGDNSDHHLLRTGKRYTYENTHGDAWHASLGLRKSLYDSLSLAVEAEYLRLKTTGSHRIVNDDIGLDYTWSHGVKVWSQQASVSVSLEYRF